MIRNGLVKIMFRPNSAFNFTKINTVVEAKLKSQTTETIWNSTLNYVCDHQTQTVRSVFGKYWSPYQLNQLQLCSNLLSSNLFT